MHQGFSSTRNSNNVRRNGLTLIELMVALTIISILAAIALPTVKNSLREQKVTRAASLVQSAIDEARARAISEGGGGGIIIDRIGVETIAQRCQSIRMRIATTPDAYTGDVGINLAAFGINQDTGQPVLWFDPSAAQMIRSANDIAASPGTPTLINIGDRVSLGDAGVTFTIEELALGSSYPANITVRDGVAGVTGILPSWVRVGVSHVEPNFIANGGVNQYRGKLFRYSIDKIPRPAIALPIALPVGTVIDLSSSGIGRYGNQFSPMAIEGQYLDTSLPPFANGGTPLDYQSVWILFGRRGEVSRILVGASGGAGLQSLEVTGDIHLLVGRSGELKTEPVEQLEDEDPDPLSDEADDDTTPLLNEESVWVTVKSRTGEVITSSWIDPTDQENASVHLIPGREVPAIVTLPPASSAIQQDRIQTVIGLTRTNAVESFDLGSK